MEYCSKYKMANLDRKKMLKAKYYLSIGIDTWIIVTSFLILLYMFHFSQETYISIKIIKH